MPAVNRSLPEIIDFCRNFEQNLKAIEEKANTLSSLGGQIESALNNTNFATKASGTVSSTAKKVIAAVQQGEERIRQMQRTAEDQLEQLRAFER
ncbi:MAG: hypothetical protein HFG78_05230 [Hungatella sp.]|jgi:gas vesicle protein|nr:hypothetical protein [Hungatella sp.]MCI9501414.1 hypothetical protein [Hungatella sp.]MCI9637020.1 hypothetical protein [Hungatella sp.]